jgi:hypothetical protein
MRWISLLYYAPALVVLLIVAADSSKYPDLWGYVRCGQAARAADHLVTDPYSSRIFVISVNYQFDKMR